MQNAPKNQPLWLFFSSNISVHAINGAHKNATLPAGRAGDRDRDTSGGRTFAVGNTWKACRLPKGNPLVEARCHCRPGFIHKRNSSSASYCRQRWSRESWGFKGSNRSNIQETFTPSRVLHPGSLTARHRKMVVARQIAFSLLVRHSSYDSEADELWEDEEVSCPWSLVRCFFGVRPSCATWFSIFGNQHDLRFKWNCMKLPRHTRVSL